jgi:hypothetical protein
MGGQQITRTRKMPHVGSNVIMMRQKSRFAPKLYLFYMILLLLLLDLPLVLGKGATTKYCGELGEECTCGRYGSIVLAKKGTCVNDDSIGDTSSNTCTSYYDTRPHVCGNYDKAASAADIDADYCGMN